MKKDCYYKPRDHYDDLTVAEVRKLPRGVHVNAVGGYKIYCRAHPKNSDWFTFVNEQGQRIIGVKDLRNHGFWKSIEDFRADAVRNRRSKAFVTACEIAHESAWWDDECYEALPSFLTETCLQEEMF